MCIIGNTAPFLGVNDHYPSIYSHFNTSVPDPNMKRCPYCLNAVTGCANGRPVPIAYLFFHAWVRFNSPFDRIRCRIFAAAVV